MCVCVTIVPANQTPYDHSALPVLSVRDHGGDRELVTNYELRVK